MYYFIAGALPDLKIGEPPEITFADFDLLLRLNLSGRDYAQVVVIRRYYDFQNIRRFLNQEELDPHGLLTEKEIEEAILTREGYPQYVFDFFDRYENDEERLKHLPELEMIHFEKEIEKADGFMKEYLIFERDLREGLAVLRSRKLGREIDLEWEGNPELEEIFSKYSDFPMELHRTLYEYRFDRIAKMYGLEMFSLRRILGYMIQLILVEKWEKLNPRKGIEFVDKLMKGVA